MKHALFVLFSFLPCFQTYCKVFVYFSQMRSEMLILISQTSIQNYFYLGEPSSAHTLYAATGTTSSLHSFDKQMRSQGPVPRRQLVTFKVPCRGSFLMRLVLEECFL